MKTKTYLKCVDAVHADFVDQFVAEHLRMERGTHCNAWSGVYTDGESYGILWAAPVSDIFGVPEDFPELELVEDSEDAWQPLQLEASDEAALV